MEQTSQTLHQAIISGSIEKVKRLIAEGHDLHYWNDHAIIESTRSIEMFNLIESYGPISEDNLIICLYRASCSGLTPMVEHLVIKYPQLLKVKYLQQAMFVAQANGYHSTHHYLTGCLEGLE
jgi:hypothetical protein